MRVAGTTTLDELEARLAERGLQIWSAHATRKVDGGGIEIALANQAAIWHGWGTTMAAAINKALAEYEKR